MKVLLDVREVAEALGCGKTYVYVLIGRGELPALKLGRLTRVPLGAVDELVRRKLAEVGFDEESRSTYTRSSGSDS